MTMFYFNIKTTLTVLTASVGLAVSASDTVSISGTITDFNGNPIDSCAVMIMNPDFSTAYETVSDDSGRYALSGVPRGKYACLYALRLKEYPRQNMVDEPDMRLEFWAWNLPAYDDMELNIRYDKLELYGTNVISEYGGRKELLIYTRPMSVTKSIDFFKADDRSDKTVTVDSRYMEFQVLADGVPLEIMSVQPLTLFNSWSSANDNCYIIQVARPENLKNRNRPCEIRVIGHNKEFDEWGENVYYYEPPRYDGR